MCPKIHLELSAECASNKWAPNYSAMGPEGACECLTEYKCCDAKCPAVDKRSCWGVDSSKKGKWHHEPRDTQDLNVTCEL